MSRLLVALVFSLTCLLPCAAHATPGDLDATLGGTGKVTAAVGESGGPHSVIQQADGKLVVAGNSTSFSNIDNLYHTTLTLLRYNLDGSLDSNFDGDGKISIDMAGNSYKMIQQSDGKLVVVGDNNVGSYKDLALMRFNPDGTLDSSFDGDGKVTTDIAGYDESAYSVIEQSDGKLLVVGEGCIPDCHPIMVRYKTDGTLDSDFNGNGKLVADISGTSFNVIQQFNGKLVWAAGDSVARYNVDGTLDQSFAVGGKISGKSPGALIQQADGKLVVASRSSDSQIAVKLFRFDNNGALDVTFDGDGETSFNFGKKQGGVGNCVFMSGHICGDTSDRILLIQQDDSQLVLGPKNSETPFYFVTFHSDGSLNNIFSTIRPPCNGCMVEPVIGSSIAAYSLTQQFDGKIVAAGIDNKKFAIRRYESAQVDTDGDTVFDELDADDDNDGVMDINDAFPLNATESSDVDGDGIGDYSDNCPFVSNRNQLNTDSDTQGDVCDSDIDNDGVANLSDNCPTISNANQLNADGDAQGNACDETPYGDAASDPGASCIVMMPAGDTDSDSVDNNCDNCPLIPNADQLNADQDSQGNACDSDDDNDGVLDASDAFPLYGAESVDTDNDGWGNLRDNCPSVSNSSQVDTDADGKGDECDSTPNGDADNDGIDYLSDNCPSIFNPDQLNTDGDTQGNTCDIDDDNDGVVDTSDPFPLDSSETTDADLDGVGDNADNCPSISNTDQLNADGDFQGDACDVFPNDPTLLLQQDGTAKAENLGSSVALADMNNDGVVDLLVGSPMANVSRSGKLLKKAGMIQIVSGKDNSVIRTISGSAPNQQLGTAIAVVDDQNADGVPDIIVGEPLADVNANAFGINRTLKGAGHVALYSGSSGVLLDVLAEGNAAGDHFGAAVAVADVNSDSKVDLVVGAPMSDVAAKDAGLVIVFNGLSKQLLYGRNGNQMGEHFGAAVAVANGHLFVGSPNFYTAAFIHAGRVSIFNNREGNSKALFTVDGGAKGDAFGAAVTASNDDWAVGSPSADSAGKDAGSVQLFVGLNTTPVKTLAGATAGDNFGSALNIQGDVNKDGTNDIAIGAAKFDVSALVNSNTVLLKDAGRVQVLSGVAL